VRLIRVTEDAIASWSDSLLVAPGEIGEITVRGPMVTREYYARPEQTRLAKIDDGGRVVHRMGDVGWMDERGASGCGGRKGQRVVTAKGTMFTVPVEEIFNAHPAGSALGAGRRGRARQPDAGARDRAREEVLALSEDALRAELLALGARRP